MNRVAENPIPRYFPDTLLFFKVLPTTNVYCSWPSSSERTKSGGFVILFSGSPVMRTWVASRLFSRCKKIINVTLCIRILTGLKCLESYEYLQILIFELINIQNYLLQFFLQPTTVCSRRSNQKTNVQFRFFRWYPDSAKTAKKLKIFTYIINQIITSQNLLA